VGFLSVVDEFFYFDLIDYFIYPDILKLYDPYGGLVLSVTDDEIAFEDDLLDDELEDEDYHFEEDELHTWFLHAKFSDQTTLWLSRYLMYIDTVLFNFKLGSFFFHKDGTKSFISNNYFVDGKVDLVKDIVVSSELENYIFVAQIFPVWFFWFGA